MQQTRISSWNEIVHSLALDSSANAIVTSHASMSLALQFGLTRVPANRAVVILLVELAVAAAASYWLAGERLRAQDWIGGSLIVLASVASAVSPTRGRPAPAPASP